MVYKVWFLVFFCSSSTGYPHNAAYIVASVGSVSRIHDSHTHCLSDWDESQLYAKFAYGKFTLPRQVVLLFVNDGKNRIRKRFVSGI